MWNAIAIRPNATMTSQQGFSTWEEAARTVAGWQDFADGAPVFIAKASETSSGEMQQYTVGELRREFKGATR